MAADSRSTHTDALATLGTILKPGEKRDAIHLGVEPCIAKETLKPGAHVGFWEDGKCVNVFEGIPCSPKPVGIVDPFLEKPVLPGESFWLIVYPRQITSLRHVWEHPDFPDSGETGGAQLLTKKTRKPRNAKVEAQPEPVKEVDLDNLPDHAAKMLLLIDDEVAKAKQRIEQVASHLQVDYEVLMSHAERYQEKDWHYWTQGSNFEGETIPDSFWEDYKKVKAIDGEVKTGSFLSCSC